MRWEDTMNRIGVEAFKSFWESVTGKAESFAYADATPVKHCVSLTTEEITCMTNLSTLALEQINDRLSRNWIMSSAARSVLKEDACNHRAINAYAKFVGERRALLNAKKEVEKACEIIEKEMVSKI